MLFGRVMEMNNLLLSLQDNKFTSSYLRTFLINSVSSCILVSILLFCSFPGGGSGIGRAVSQRLASEGASVVVADISEESANETLGSLQNAVRGQSHMAAAVDVSSKESVTKLVTSIQVRETSGDLLHVKTMRGSFIRETSVSLRFSVSISNLVCYHGNF